jgi:hypothetical protein
VPCLTAFSATKCLSVLMFSAQILLCGCATPNTAPDVNAQHVNQQRNGAINYPDVIVYSNNEPEVEFDFIESRAHAASAGAGAGSDGAADSCHAVSGPFGALACFLVFSSIGAVSGALDAESADAVHNVEANLWESIPQSSQKRLAMDVHKRLAEAAVYSPLLITSDQIDDVYRGNNYRTILIVTFDKFIFKGRGVKNDPICLDMQATATKSDALTRKQLDTLTTSINGDCESYNDWIKDGGRKVSEGIDAGYEKLSDLIVDRYFNEYPAWELREDTVRKFRQEAGIYCSNADLGHADVQKRIGDIYYSEFYTYSTPVNRDLKRAYVWYRLSYEGGYKDAEDSLKQVESELSPHQLAEAQQMFAQ